MQLEYSLFNSINKGYINIQEPVKFTIHIFSVHFKSKTDSWSSVRRPDKELFIHERAIYLHNLFYLS